MTGKVTQGIEPKKFKKFIDAIQGTGKATLKLPIVRKVLSLSSEAQKRRIVAAVSEPAGLLYRTTSEVTGVTGSVYDPKKQGIDIGGEKYAVVCEKHSQILSVHKMSLAKHDAANTEQWCEDCRDIAEKKAKQKKRRNPPKHWKAIAAAAFFLPLIPP